jgi:hypothetical protein
MGEIVLHLPSDLEEGIENLVSRGIYMEKEEAIIALIKAGLIAWRKREETGVHPIPEYPPPFKPPEKWPDHYEFNK